MSYQDQGDLKPTDTVVPPQYQDQGDLKPTGTSQLNTQQSSDQQDLPEASLANKVTRTAVHSLYEGLVRPIAGLGNLGTELLHLHGVNNYLTDKIKKADEWNKSLDAGYKPDWADKDGWASTLGSWAALLIPATGEAKGLEGIGAGLKALTDPETSKAEQAITEGWNGINKAIKEDRSENGLVNAQELTDARKDLQNAQQTQIYNKERGIETKQDANNIQTAKNKVDQLEKKQADISKAQGKFNSDVAESFDSMGKTAAQMNPKLSTTLIDHFLTGKKGYGIGQGAVLGGTMAAADNSTDNSYHQLLSAGVGAALGGIGTGFIGYLTHQTPNLLREFTKDPKQTYTPQFTDNQEKLAKTLKDTPPTMSESEIATQIANHAQYLDDEQKALTHIGHLININNVHVPYIESETNVKQKTLNEFDILKNIRDYYQKAKFKHDLRNQSNTPDETIRNVNLRPKDEVKKPDAADIALGYGQSLAGKVKGDSNDPNDITNYVIESNKIITPIQTILHEPNLETNKEIANFLEGEITQAYTNAAKNKVKVDIGNHVKSISNFLNEHKAALGHIQKTYDPLTNTLYQNTNAYNGLKDATNYLISLAKQKENNIENVTHEDIKNGLNSLNPYAQSRLKEELNNNNNDIKSTYENLFNRLYAFNKSITDGKVDLKRDPTNKHEAMYHELQTKTAETMDGNQIPVTQLKSIRDELKNMLDNPAINQRTDEFYHSVGHLINKSANDAQDEIVNQHLQKKYGTPEISDYIRNKYEYNPSKAQDAKNIPIAVLQKDAKNPISFTDILRQIKQNIESGKVMRKYLEDRSGQHSGYQNESMTIAKKAQSVNRPDIYTNNFTDELDRLQHNNDNIKYLLRIYGDENGKGGLDNIKKQLSRLKGFSTKQNATDSDHNNPLKIQAAAAIIAAHSQLQKLLKEDEDTKKAMANQIKYLGWNGLLGKIQNDHSIKNVGKIVPHMIRYIKLGLFSDSSHPHVFAEEGLNNLFFRPDDKLDFKDLPLQQKHIITMQPSRDVNSIYDTTDPEVLERIRSLTKEDKIPLYKDGKITHKKLKDAQLDEIYKSVKYIQRKAEQLQNSIKNTREFTSTTAKTMGQNIDNIIRNMVPKFSPHLPRHKLQVAPVVATIPNGGLNYLFSNSKTDSNQ